MATQSLTGILSTIGDTPLIELDRLIPSFLGRLYAKLERFNPGGSVKDRSALSLLRAKIDNRELVPDRSVVIESSSGNLAIGLAQICRYFGLRFICVVDSKTTEQNIAILRAFQAEVEVVDQPDPVSGEYLAARLARVRELVAATPGGYWPNQYGNPLNPLAHLQTMHEVAEALDGRVDYLFLAVSSCGTLRGCAEYVRTHRLPTRIVAVDAVGSMIFDGQRTGLRRIPGHGSSVRPALFDPDAADDVVHVSDLDCIVACRRLINREAILAGGSSGAVVAAFERSVATIPDHSTCVLIFPDGGDRYLDTVYSDDWVRKSFGEVSHLWEKSTGEELIRC